MNISINYVCGIAKDALEKNCAKSEFTFLHSHFECLHIKNNIIRSYIIQHSTKEILWTLRGFITLIKLDFFSGFATVRLISCHSVSHSVWTQGSIVGIQEMFNSLGKRLQLDPILIPFSLNDLIADQFH
jgi:ABC-type uncharacterized transport system permease subunit